MKNRSLSFTSWNRLRLAVLLVMLPLAASAAGTKAWILLMQNPDNAQSILSTNENEKNNLVQAGWKLTAAGTVTFDAAAGKVMVYRMLRNGDDLARRLAVSPEQMAANQKLGFVSEGAMGYVSQNEVAGGVPVHCFKKGDRYIWVSGNDEQYWADHNGWTREPGIFWLGPLTKS